MNKVIVTGGAGFIGSHVCRQLLENGCDVTAVDNLDPFYAPQEKLQNIASLQENAHFRLLIQDIRDSTSLERVLSARYDALIHLAGKAGVRPSISDPLAYQSTNVAGTQTLLELARKKGISQFVFASSSSVYGVNPNVPWHEDDHVLLPISPYVALGRLATTEAEPDSMVQNSWPA